MFLNLTDIKDMAANPAVFSRAQSFYFSGGMIEYYVTYDSLDLYQIFAVVHDENKEFRIQISLDEKSKITDETCDCKGFHTKFGACKHVIAVLLKVQDDQNRNTLTIHKALDSDDDLLLDLIDIYEQQLIQDLSSEVLEADVLLIPKLVFNKGYETSVECSIGKTRTYVVKDIYKLCQDIRSESLVSYGKELEFRHSLNIFEEDSQSLVKFVCSVSEELNTYIEKLTQSRAYFTVGTKDLYLSPANFDKFFNLYRGKTVSCKTPDYVLEQVTLLDYNPSLEFKLIEEETEYILSHNLGLCTMIQGHDSNYLLTEGNIYRLDKEFCKHVLPLLKRMGELPYFELKMNEAYMGKFLSVLLPNIKKYLRHSSLNSLYERFEVYPLNTKFYLDSEIRGALNLRVEFHYGDIVIDALDLQNQALGNTILRDATKEAGISAMILRHHFTIKKEIYRLDDEDYIYEFVQHGINDLAKIGEVFASEAFKKIKIKEPKSLSMGIRVDSKLLKVNFEELEFQPADYKKILAAYRVNKKYFRLKDGSYLNLKNDYLDSLSSFIDDFHLSDSALFEEEIELPKYTAFYLQSLTEKSHVLQAKTDLSFNALIEEFQSVDEAEFMVPSSLDPTLRSYQKTGYKWLRTLSKYNMGGILADDMGLGKTIQVITLLLSGHDQKKKPSIIVAPSSLLYNWKREIEKFAPVLSVCVITGNASERKKLIEEQQHCDLYITSYDLLRRDISTYELIEFEYCVLDEAHYIKNHQTQNAKSVKKIRSQLRFALTGTPIENSLSDLWSIFDFIMPGYLGSYTHFKKKYEVPIIRQNNAALLGRLHQQVAPFILRRLKKDVLKELPDKIESVVYCEMEEEQRKIYFATLHQMRKEFHADLEVVGIERSRIKVLALLMRLRQLCCHPSLYLDNYKAESAKLNLCLELVNDCIASGHKILIFSQFTSMLDILSTELRKQEIQHYMLTGETKTKDRLELTEAFNEGDVPVFLISLKAGGTGLNLTGADVVIHYDPWWNMSAQNQATDRAHRIGQLQNVQVFKLIVKETIEEKIEELQKMKMDLTESVVKEGETFINKLSNDEIVALFDDEAIDIS